MRRSGYTVNEAASTIRTTSFLLHPWAWRRMRAFLVLVALMLVAGCAQDAGPTPTPPTGTPTPTATPGGTPTPSFRPTPDVTPATPGGPVLPPRGAPADDEVHIINATYMHQNTTIDVGRSVTWTNFDPVDHTVTSDNGSFDSGDLTNGTQFSHSFATAGNYSYHCEKHPQMRGMIIVVNTTVDSTITPTVTPTTIPTPTATPTPTPTPTPSPTPSSPPTEVAIRGFAFSPPSLSISVGTTVRWTNYDAMAHTAMADAGAFDTGRLERDASAEYTFSTAGAFAYHCAIHPSMTATVTVT